MTASSERVCAVDLGKVRVGVAVSDELGAMAHPRPALDGQNRKALLAGLSALAEAEGITLFVVGLPVEMGGAEGPAAQRALKFAEALANATGRSVEVLDERLTTVEAARRIGEAGKRRRAQQGEHRQRTSAAVLLQAWLDARRGRAR
ncbi:MAG: Holliday junction resolvase RuvX [Polyangiaceae bacterium]